MSDNQMASGKIISDAKADEFIEQLDLIESVVKEHLFISFEDKIGVHSTCSCGAFVENYSRHLSNAIAIAILNREPEFKPQHFVKKPVVIEAMQLAGTPAEMHTVYRWIEQNTQGSYDTNDTAEPVPASGVSIDARTGFLVIATLEGQMQAKPGDWIIRGVQGEFYPCKPDIFSETYELLQGDNNGA